MTDPMLRLSRIDDYVTRAMDDAEAERFEEALFEEAGDGALEFVDRVAQLSARAVALRTFDVAITRAEIEELVAEGRHVALLDLGDPNVQFEVPDDTEIVVTRIPVGLTGVAKIDIEIETLDHASMKTIRDAKVDPTDGSVYACCDVSLFRIATGVPCVSRFVVERDGKREVLFTHVVDGAAPGQ